MDGYPWFKFYAAEWLGKNEHRLLNAEARGMLIQLYAESWMSDDPAGKLPNNPNLLWKLAGADSREQFERVFPLLANCFLNVEESLIPRWLLNLRVSKSRERKIRSELGKKGAEVRKQKHDALLHNSGLADAVADQDVEKDKEQIRKRDRPTPPLSTAKRSAPNHPFGVTEEQWEERRRQEKLKADLLLKKGIR